MQARDQLAQQFEQHRSKLRAVALRMLGSRTEAEDAVQETWLRLSGVGARELENVGGFLTTVVARICLDMLRSRKARREAPGGTEELAESAPAEAESSVEQQALIDSVGLALLVVLETLPPAERVAFVLHDLFDVGFDEIAPILERTPTAARQLASRGRRRVQGRPATLDTDRARRQELVQGFLAASRSGDLQALLRVLDADVVLRTDATAAKLGSPPETRGAERVAKLFLGRAQAARVALIDGELGFRVVPKGKLLLVVTLTFDGERITELEAVADPRSLGEMELVPLEPDPAS